MNLKVKTEDGLTNIYCGDIEGQQNVESMTAEEIGLLKSEAEHTMDTCYLHEKVFVGNFVAKLRAEASKNQGKFFSKGWF